MLMPRNKKMWFVVAVKNSFYTWLDYFTEFICNFVVISAIFVKYKC